MKNEESMALDVIKKYYDFGGEVIISLGLCVICIFVSCENRTNQNIPIGVSQRKEIVCSRIERIHVLIDDGDSIIYNMMDKMTAQDVYEFYQNLDIAGISQNEVDFQVKYTDLGMEFYGEALLRRGYRKPTANEKESRFKEIFGCELDSANKYMYPKMLGRYVYDRNDTEGRAAQAEFMQSGKETFFDSYIFDDRVGFVVKNPSLYGLVYVEGSVVDLDEGSLVKLGDSVACNLNHSEISMALFRNNFIFHNSQAALNWLCSNDELFLKDLCRIYGYDTVAVINDLVIKDAVESWHNYSDANRQMVCFENLFVRHDGLRNLQIHSGLLDYAKTYNSTNSDREILLFDEVFSDFKINVLTSLRDSVPAFLSDFSLPERMQIAAYVGYYYHRSGAMTTHNVFRKELFENDDFVRFIESHDYFGLDGFQDLIESLVEEEEEARNLSLLRSSEN